MQPNITRRLLGNSWLKKMTIQTMQTWDNEQMLRMQQGLIGLGIRFKQICLILSFTIAMTFAVLPKQEKYYKESAVIKGLLVNIPSDRARFQPGKIIGTLEARSIQPTFQPVRPGNWSNSKGGPVFSKLCRLDRTDPLSLGPKFPEMLVAWIAPWSSHKPYRKRSLIIRSSTPNYNVPPPRLQL